MDVRPGLALLAGLVLLPAAVTLGLAFTHTGMLYPFFAAMLGWLGVALTGSDTSSNALFGSLQRFTAERLGLNPVLICAANRPATIGAANDVPLTTTYACASVAADISAPGAAKATCFPRQASTSTRLRASTPVTAITPG